MKERPILFSGAMVRAILEGRKTQTRRVCKARGVDFIGSGGRSGADWNDPDCWGYEAGDGEWYVLSRSPSNGMRSIVCPYGQPGDRLWVRETFDDMHGMTLYRANPEDEAIFPPCTSGRCKWQPSIFMPRALSRIQLDLLSVRVERVQDIDAIDAMHEGITAPMLTDEYATMREGFAQLWDTINAKRGYGWDVNPWVWVLTFKRVRP